MKEDEPACYAVLIDLQPEDPDHPRHQCECFGFLRWGHRTLCKHVAALLAIIRSGRLDAEPTPTTSPTTPEAAEAA